MLIWKMTVRDEKRINAFQFKCLRRILKIRWQQHVPNTRIAEMAGVTKISSEVRRRRWNWIGHVLRKERDDHSVEALDWADRREKKCGQTQNHMAEDGTK